MKTKGSYFELLKDPRWQRKRLEIFERDMWECTVCESKSDTLHVHHKVYRKGLKPWESPDDDLTTVCEDCHKLYTRQQERLKDLVARMGYRDVEFMIGWASALHAFVSGEPARLDVEGPDDGAGIAAFFQISFADVMGRSGADGVSVSELDALSRVPKS